MNIIDVLAFILKVLLDKLNEIRRLVKKGMADIQTTLDDIEAKLDEASAEILAEIAKLQGEQLTDAGKASLARIQGKAQGLADIVPGSPTPPPTT